MSPINKFTNLLLSAPYNPPPPLNWIHCPEDQTICILHHFSRTLFLKLPPFSHHDISPLSQITPVCLQHGKTAATFFLFFNFLFISLLLLFHCSVLYGKMPGRSLHPRCLHTSFPHIPLWILFHFLNNEEIIH